MDSDLAKQYKNSQKEEKFVKVWWHSSQALQIPLQIDDFFLTTILKCSHKLHIQKPQKHIQNLLGDLILTLFRAVKPHDKKIQRKMKKRYKKIHWALYLMPEHFHFAWYLPWRIDGQTRSSKLFSFVHNHPLLSLMKRSASWLALICFVVGMDRRSRIFNDSINYRLWYSQNYAMCLEEIYIYFLSSVYSKYL